MVGWYKGATVYRELQDIMRGDMESCYNVVADAQNCVLLPRNERDKGKWEVPVSTKVGYGFGSALTWYPSNDGSEKMLTRLLTNIDDYQGANWINLFNY